jgi:hypothetical protein
MRVTQEYEFWQWIKPVEKEIDGAKNGFHLEKKRGNNNYYYF